MLNVARWLAEQGLGHHAEAFAANGIGGDILRELTDVDLRELGLNLGDRKRLLKAIAALDAGSTDAPAETGEPCATPAISHEAERRRLTVMFVDLVGSTALSATLDPEDMREVIRAYQNTVAGEIGRFEGHVAKFMGDGVLAYFGYPRAHEDEAEQAVRAGLALAQTVGRLKAPTSKPLSARIGIATGLVVVGNLVGEGAAEEHAVVGDTPNLAARLQALADPGRVVIADATRRLLGMGFEIEDLGEREFKGIGEPVPVFAVRGERPVESRFEAKSGPSLLPLVGRDQELALLLERWAQAKAGEGQGILLVGEAGIGKSRIGRALLDALADEPHTRIRYQCSPYHTDSALWPVIQQLSRAADLAADDPVEAKLDKLEALLAQAGGRAAAPLVAELIGLDGAARYGALGLTPQVQRARTLETLVEQLLGLATRQPILMVLEDAHWIDPTTLELIEQCLDRIADRGVLILLTSRPEHQPELAAHPHVTRLTLNRLSRAAVEAIVERLQGGTIIPTETIAAIIARTDGMPLFVEELTKAVLETGETAIPASLHDSLMARLDRIPEVKEVAQTAACIGREFPHAVLAAVVQQDEDLLCGALDQLIGSGLIFRRGTPPAATYTFKHALVQDAAYESLLRSRRQELHGRIARRLEELFPETVASEPEVLARHHGAAGDMEKAFQYWLEAGRRAAERSANLEAIQHLIKARDALATLPDNPERIRHELDVLMTLGPAFSAAKGFAAGEVEQTYVRVRALWHVLGEADQSPAALQGLRVLYVARGDLVAAGELGDELLALGEREGSPSHQFEGHLALGIVGEFRGQFAIARSHLERALALFDPTRMGSLVRQPTGNPLVTCLGHLATLLFLAGFPEQSRQRSREALDMARASAHPFSLAQALGSPGVVNFFGRPFLDARNAVALVALAEEQRFDFWHVHGLAMRGWANAAEGRTEEGVTDLRDALAAAATMGADLVRAYGLTALAATLGQTGEVQEALSLLAEQRRLAIRTGVACQDTPVRLLEGELRLKLPSHDLAIVEACFRDALAIARRQESRMLELRAATSLARLWRDQGRRADAHDLLAPVYGWFTEGFGTVNLKEAKALLDELA